MAKNHSHSTSTDKRIDELKYNGTEWAIDIKFPCNKGKLF